LSALQALSEEEQEVIRLGWSRGRYTDDPAYTAPSTATPPPPKPSHTPSLDTRAPEEVEDTAEEAIERISSMEDTLRTLVGRYRSSLPSPTIRDARGGIDDVVEHIVELEKLSESLDVAAERATLDHAERRSTRQAARDYVDDRLGELLPPGEFSETRRQNELTLEEGRIIEELMRPKSVEAEGVASEEPEAGSSSAGMETPVKPEAPSIPADVSSLPILAGYLDAAEPLDRLDALIEAAPPVRDIYDRALFVPTAETHADCRDLLARLGVPVLMAEPPYEAEGLATSLALAGVVDWVGSEDSDVIPLGVSLTYSRAGGSS
jgi:flap endonuclease-1